MRDLNEDSSSSSWPLFHGDKTIPNGQYHNGFMPRISIDGYQGRDKDTLKQKMLEHESVFKNQVFCFQFIIIYPASQLTHFLFLKKSLM